MVDGPWSAGTADRSEEGKAGKEVTPCSKRQIVVTYMTLHTGGEGSFTL
jgi:hypothetical protein